MWITLEAKSDQNPDGPVAVRDVREANTQLRLLSRDRGIDPPENSFSVIISRRSTVDPNAAHAADPHLHLLEPGTLIALADDLQRAWAELFDKAPGHTPGDALEMLVRRVLGAHQVLPSQVRERLTATCLAS